jgi:hypothetical protein
MKYKGTYPTKIMFDNKLWILDHTYREYPESFTLAYGGLLISEPEKPKKKDKEIIIENEVIDNGI